VVRPIMRPNRRWSVWSSLRTCSNQDNPTKSE
jgi:hypothetical protein